MSPSKPCRPSELCSRNAVTADSVNSPRQPGITVIFQSNSCALEVLQLLRSIESQHRNLPSSRNALNIRRQRKRLSHEVPQSQNCQIPRPRSAPQNGRLVARGQSSLSRRDVSLRQTCAQATAKQEHVNPRLLSHLRATPGLSVSYVRLSRLLQERGINLIIIISPGRSGAGLEGVEWFVPR